MSDLDKAKTTAATAILLVGLYFSILGLVSSPVPLRLAVFFGALAVAGGLMYFSEPGKRFVAYCQGSAIEARKVVWPNREEVMKMSGVVLLFVTVVAIFLWLVDAILAWLLRFLAL